jgi:hypothetical protein
MTSATEGPSPDAFRVRVEDAGIVAKRVFQDFDLSDEELGHAAETIAMISGGPEFERVLSNAMKKPGQPWATVSLERREDCVHQTFLFHCSPADMEQMALRTGAVALLLGEDLGRKILSAAPESGYGVEPVGTAGWLTVAQFCLYVMMFVILGVQSAVSGLYQILIPGAVALVVGLVILWVLERNRPGLRRQKGEAQRYARSLELIARGIKPTDIFFPDGRLRELPE